MSFIEYLEVLFKYLTRVRQKLLPVWLMGNLRILNSNVCITSVDSPSSTIPSSCEMRFAFGHLSAVYLQSCVCLFGFKPNLGLD